MIKLILCGIVLLNGLLICAQPKTENLIVVTMDGLRWQEVFKGADPVLIHSLQYTADTGKIIKEFWADSPLERRQKLFPFLWSTMATQGQLYGNRTTGSLVNTANPYWFSYPGYNEIFTGHADTLVNSNDKIPNKHQNVLEYLNTFPGLSGKVAAFSSWEVFDAILNEQRSKILVNAAYDSLPVQLLADPVMKAIQKMQNGSAAPWGHEVRPDQYTYYLARHYLQVYRPKVLYISFGETDEYAHEGNYAAYLRAAQRTDKWLEDLWQLLGTLPGYKGKTTLLITTDHGRGDLIKKEWTSHGSKIEGADQIWLGVIGPDTPSQGEIKGGPQVYQQQIAATLARLLGKQFVTGHPVAAPIDGVVH